MRKNNLVPAVDNTEENIRERAVQNVKNVQLQDVEDMSPEKARHVLQELLIYQAELEMQNEELQRAQTELDNARRRYFELYDLAPVGYCTVNDKDFVIEANFTVGRMFGLESRVFVNQSLFRFIRQEDFGHYHALIKKLRKQEAPQNCELRMVRQDGTWFWARLEASAVDQDDGKFVRIVISDISESKRVGEVLQEGEEFFRTSFEEHDAIKMHIDPQTGAIIRVNKAAAKFYGWPQEQLEHMLIQDISVNETADRLADFFSARMKNKPARVFQHCLRDSSVRYMEVFASRIVYRERELLHCIAHDITDQIQAELALKQSEGKYRALSEDMPLMVCRFNPDLRLTYVNAAYCANFGRSAEQLLGTSFLDLIPEHEHQAGRAVIASMTPDSPSVVHEHQVFDNHGHVRWKRWTNRALYDVKDRIIAYQAIGEDITDRKLADEEIRRKTAQLERANAEKDKLFTIIAHDLKTPISGLLTSTELLANDIEIFSEEDIRRLARALNKSTQSAYALLEDLLQWARMSQGGLDFAPSACSLNEMINASLFSTQDLCNQKGITLSLNVQANLCVFIDRPMINTVIRNILFNAVKFTPRGGTIDISALLKGAFVKMVIRDSGIGMSEKILADLFTITKRKVQFGTEGESGTGLGLVFCKEFIEKHGGQIWVESKPGKGTSVFFTLPVSE